MFFHPTTEKKPQKPKKQKKTKQKTPPNKQNLFLQEGTVQFLPGIEHLGAMQHLKLFAMSELLQ